MRLALPYAGDNHTDTIERPLDRVRIIDVDPSREAGRLLGMTPGDDDAIWMARLELRRKATADLAVAANDQDLGHLRHGSPGAPSSGRSKRRAKHAQPWLGACCWRVMHLAAILNPSVVVCVAASVASHVTTASRTATRPQ
ncbi:MAG: hypothetical protein U0270_27120 [Labilithrix sp.]